MAQKIVPPRAGSLALLHSNFTKAGFGVLRFIIRPRLHDSLFPGVISKPLKNLLLSLIVFDQTKTYWQLNGGFALRFPLVLWIVINPDVEELVG
jgi:hypothetical protein